MAEAKKSKIGYSKISYAVISALAVISILMPMLAVIYRFISVTSVGGGGTVSITEFASAPVTALSIVTLVISALSFIALVFAIVVCNKERLSVSVMSLATLAALISSILYMVAGFIAAAGSDQVKIGLTIFSFIFTAVTVCAYFLTAILTHKVKREKFINAVWHTFIVKWIWKGFFVNIVYGKFDKYKGWIYLFPALVLLAVFTVWPIFNTIRISLLEGYNSSIPNANYKFGFGNFSYVMGYSGFINALTNTVFLCVITVPISTFLALLIAVCLNAIKPLQRMFQTIFFLPYVTNSIAIGMVFMAMFNMFLGGGARPDSVGIINNVLEFFGFDYVNWVNVGSEKWANMVVLVVYIVWNALPFKILILLGGLQSVNKQYYEAAKVDGTPRWRVFTRITVPLLSPMLAYVVITGFIGGFKEYSSIIGIFGEKMGPPGAMTSYPLDTMVGYIYRMLETGYAGDSSAAALILFGIIFLVTMVNLYVSKKKTHY